MIRLHQSAVLHSNFSKLGYATLTRFLHYQQHLRRMPSLNFNLKLWFVIFDWARELIEFRPVSFGAVGMTLRLLYTLTRPKWVRYIPNHFRLRILPKLITDKNAYFYGSWMFVSQNIYIPKSVILGGILYPSLIKGIIASRTLSLLEYQYHSRDLCST